MLVLTVTLTLFSIAVYHRFSSGLYSDLDDVLLSRAEGIDDAIDMFWQRKQTGMQQGAVPLPQAAEIPAVSFVKVARQWIDEESAQPKLLDIIVRIYDVNGLNIVSFPNEEAVSSLPDGVLKSVIRGQRHVDNIRLETVRGGMVTVRSWTVPVVKEGKIAYIVQVGSPLDSIETARLELRLILFVLLPLTILLTGVAGAFLAKKTLNPVTDMIYTIRQITASNMKLRLSVPDTRDEIRQLADTFNSMLVRLDTALTAQQQLVQDISHEFKTPLTILRGQFEVALKRPRSSEEYSSVLSSSIEEIDKLNGIVADLLVLSRFDNKQARLKPRRFDLGELVGKTAHALKVLADEKEINIEVTAEGGVTLEADDELIRRVVQNLLSNAVKYTGRGGRIVITVGRSAEHACLVMSDTGIGIPSEELPFIFDRFYCVDKSHCSHGLGLSIVKSIVEAHHGTVSVESEVGVGTTFTVLLPSSHPSFRPGL